MKTSRLATVVAVLALALAACGGGDAETTTTTADDATTTTGAGTTVTTGATTTTAGGATTTAAGGDGPVEITVVAAALAFDTAEITVKAGQEVTLILDNQDLSSDEGHNIHVRTTTADYFTGIHTAPDTQEITFTIAEPGTYQFFCDTHSTTMLGAFIVTP